MITSVSEEALPIRFRGSESPDLKRARRLRKPNEAATVDRLPPHCTQSEMAVIGGVLVSPNECLSECIARFGKHGSAVFYDLRHQIIYDAFIEMFDRREAIDVITLQAHLNQKGVLQDAGGLAYIYPLPDAIISVANFSYYLDIVWEKFQLRSLIHTCTDVVGRVYDFTGTVDELMDTVERDLLRVFSLDELAAKQLTIKDAVKAAIKEIEDLHGKKGAIGLPTGLYDLDKLTCGLHASEMTVIAGRPSTGKTSLAMNIVEHVSVDLKIPSGVFSLEMSTKSLVLRMLCARAKVDARSVREGYLTVGDFEKLAVASKDIALAPLHIDDTAALSITALRSKMLRMHQLYGIKLAVIDYLQLMNAGGRRNENRQQEIAAISSGVKALAKELDIPVIVLSQLNRDMEKNAGKKSVQRKPRMSDLRESGAIEQDADVIGLLWRPDDKEEGAVELVVAKQRNGPTGDIPLTFLKQHTRFENAARSTGES